MTNKEIERARELAARRALAVPLDVFIRQGQGRCQECGNHPETQQGHLEDCSRTGGRR